MNTTHTCPECGKPVCSNSLGGLCPECMLKVGSAPQTAEMDPGGTPGANPPVAAPSLAEIARLFPNLEILGAIGCGGMGAIYKARQPRLDRLVALKVLLRAHDDQFRDARFTERFEREARALAKLSHPNIVAMYEFGQVEALPYFIMEYVDGLNLRQLELAGKLSPQQALKIVPQICEALQFAHESGVIHRDIKPENILLDQKGRVKIADFGIAKILGRDSGGPTLTEGLQVIGTPHYMAPEQVEKPRAVDHRADIYSLGVVFYEMLTGELPLGKFAPPSKTVQVDVRLDEVVLHALEKQPDRRYQQASQVKTDVETIAASRHPATPQMNAISGAVNPWQPAILLAGGLVSLAVLVAGMMVPSPITVIAFLSGSLGLVIAISKLAGFWPFPSGLFARSSFTGRNLPGGKQGLVTIVLTGIVFGITAFMIMLTGRFTRASEPTREPPTVEIGTDLTPVGQVTVPQVATPPSATPPSRPLLARVADLPPLSSEEIEKYVGQNKRTAESLLAAYRGGTNPAYLKEAAARFPDDPDVQYAVITARVFPEAQRQWIDTYKASSPDNALAWYLSALDKFQAGEKAEALSELAEATRKPAFRAEIGPTLQALEELNLSAGRAADESKLAAFQSVAQSPHLMPMRELAKAVQATVQRNRQDGNAASAASAAGMGLALGGHLSAGGGSQTLISQLVGISIERMFLRELDPVQDQDAFGRPTADVARAVDQHQAALKELATAMADLTRTLADSELATYMERVKLYGEEAALMWLRSKHGQQ